MGCHIWSSWPRQYSTPVLCRKTASHLYSTSFTSLLLIPPFCVCGKTKWGQQLLLLSTGLNLKRKEKEGLFKRTKKINKRQRERACSLREERSDSEVEEYNYMGKTNIPGIDTHTFSYEPKKKKNVWKYISFSDLWQMPPSRPKTWREISGRGWRRLVTAVSVPYSTHSYVRSTIHHSEIPRSHLNSAGTLDTNRVTSFNKAVQSPAKG